MAKSKLKHAEREEYRTLGDEALEDRISEGESRLKKMKFSHAVNPIENPMTIRDARRTLARLKTEQHKRELGS